MNVRKVWTRRDNRRLNFILGLLSTAFWLLYAADAIWRLGTRFTTPYFVLLGALALPIAIIAFLFPSSPEVDPDVLTALLAAHEPDAAWTLLQYLGRIPSTLNVAALDHIAVLLGDVSRSAQPLQRRQSRLLRDLVCESARGGRYLPRTPARRAAAAALQVLENSGDSSDRAFAEQAAGKLREETCRR